MKKKEKKMKTEEDVDEMIGNEEYGQQNDDDDEEENLEKFADKVIDDEYKRIGKDIDADDIKNFIFKKKKVEEKRFLEYLKQIGMDLKSKLKFDHFADMMRNQKLFSLNKGKKEELEEDEKNKQDTNINETKENE